MLGHQYKDIEFISPHNLPRMWGWGRRRGLGGGPSDAPFLHQDLPGGPPDVRREIDSLSTVSGPRPVA